MGTMAATDAKTLKESSYSILPIDDDPGNRHHRDPKVIGKGSFGTVLSLGDANGATFAVKLCHRSQVKTLRREYKMYKDVLVNIPGVQCATDYIVCEPDGEAMVMPMMGPSLCKILSEMHPSVLRPTTILKIAWDMLETLEHIHSRCIVHRDIKPSNLVVGPRRTGCGTRATLIDFGIAKTFDPVDEGPLRTYVRGTMLYASSRAHFGRNLGARDDLESLAYTLNAMAAGQAVLPWHDVLSATDTEGKF